MYAYTHVLPKQLQTKSKQIPRVPKKFRESSKTVSKEVRRAPNKLRTNSEKVPTDFQRRCQHTVRGHQRSRDSDQAKLAPLITGKRQRSGTAKTSATSTSADVGSQHTTIDYEVLSFEHLLQTAATGGQQND